MSWLARSIANSLRIDDDDDTTLPPPSSSHSRREKPPASVISVEERENIEFDGDLRGVKDDLSEFKETLTRQLWGVANFLAPPPCTACSSSSHDHRVVPELDRSESISGVEDDDESLVYGLNSTEDGNYSDIGDRNLGNCESSSSLHRLGLQKVEEEDDDWVKEAVGLTDEVLTFAGNIAHHPETWLDFPVEEDEDFEDFPMSESQKRHAQAVEHLSPRLAALRIELCPAHMSVGFFWKVYFVLLHSRLNKQDADLLSTLEPFSLI
uniref:BSD domain-containing protein n=1 Tax=Chenopodium quinoa TaxID=63459 RepID=A0A803MYW2_CHEQI